MATVSQALIYVVGSRQETQRNAWLSSCERAPSGGDRICVHGGLVMRAGLRIKNGRVADIMERAFRSFPCAQDLNPAPNDRPLTG
jgi:hypothetical protein